MKKLQNMKQQERENNHVGNQIEDPPKYEKQLLMYWDEEHPTYNLKKYEKTNIWKAIYNKTLKIFKQVQKGNVDMESLSDRLAMDHLECPWKNHGYATIYYLYQANKVILINNNILRVYDAQEILENENPVQQTKINPLFQHKLQGKKHLFTASKDHTTAVFVDNDKVYQLILKNTKITCKLVETLCNISSLDIDVDGQNNVELYLTFYEQPHIYSYIKSELNICSMLRQSKISAIKKLDQHILAFYQSTSTIKHKFLPLTQKKASLKIDDIKQMDKCPQLLKPSIIASPFQADCVVSMFDSTLILFNGKSQKETTLNIKREPKTLSWFDKKTLLLSYDESTILWDIEKDQEVYKEKETTVNYKYASQLSPSGTCFVLESDPNHEMYKEKRDELIQQDEQRVPTNVILYYMFMIREWILAFIFDDTSTTFPESWELSYNVYSIVKYDIKNLYKSLIENEEYKKAESLAHKYNLDAEIICKYKWLRSSSKSGEEILLYLKKVTDKPWVISQCLHSQPATISDTLSLLAYVEKLSFIDPPNLQIAQRYIALLKTFQNETVFDESNLLSNYFAIRSEDDKTIANHFAKKNALIALKNHLAKMENLNDETFIDIISQIPLTTPPSKYKRFLKGKDGLEFDAFYNDRVEQLENQTGYIHYIIQLLDIGIQNKLDSLKPTLKLYLALEYVMFELNISNLNMVQFKALTTFEKFLQCFNTSGDSDVDMVRFNALPFLSQFYPEDMHDVLYQYMQHLDERFHAEYRSHKKTTLTIDTVFDILKLLKETDSSLSPSIQELVEKEMEQLSISHFETYWKTASSLCSNNSAKLSSLHSQIQSLYIFQKYKIDVSLEDLQQVQTQQDVATMLYKMINYGVDAIDRASPQSPKQHEYDQYKLLIEDIKSLRTTISQFDKFWDTIDWQIQLIQQFISKEKYNLLDEFMDTHQSTIDDILYNKVSSILAGTVNLTKSIMQTTPIIQFLKNYSSITSTKRWKEEQSIVEFLTEAKSMLNLNQFDIGLIRQSKSARDVLVNILMNVDSISMDMQPQLFELVSLLDTKFSSDDEITYMLAQYFVDNAKFNEGLTLCLKLMDIDYLPVLPLCARLAKEEAIDKSHRFMIISWVVLHCDPATLQSHLQLYYELEKACKKSGTISKVFNVTKGLFKTSNVFLSNQQEEEIEKTLLTNPHMHGKIQLTPYKHQERDIEILRSSLGNETVLSDDILLEFATNSFIHDTFGSFMYLFCLKDSTKADSLFEKFLKEPSLRSYQKYDEIITLATYYFYIQQHTTQFLEPQMTIDDIKQLIPDTIEADATLPLVKYFKLYEQLVDVQKISAILEKKQFKVDPHQLLNDFQYRNKFICEIAYSKKEEHFNYACSLASRYEIPYARIVLNYLQLLFEEHKPFTNEEKDKIREIVGRVPEDEKEMLITGMDKIVSNIIDPYDADRLTLAYELSKGTSHVYHIICSRINSCESFSLNFKKYKWFMKTKKVVNSDNFRDLFKVDLLTLDHLATLLFLKKYIQIEAHLIERLVLENTMSTISNDAVLDSESFKAIKQHENWSTLLNRLHIDDIINFMNKYIMTIQLSDNTNVLSSRTTILKEIVHLRVYKSFSDPSQTIEDIFLTYDIKKFWNQPYHDESMTSMIEDFILKLRQIYYDTKEDYEILKKETQGELSKLMQLTCAYDRLIVLLHINNMKDFPRSLIPHWHYHIMKENPSRNSFIKTLLSCLYIDPAYWQPLAILMDSIRGWNIHYQLCGKFESFYQGLSYIFEHVMEKIETYAQDMPKKYHFTKCSRQDLPTSIPLATFESSIQLFSFLCHLTYNQLVDHKSHENETTFWEYIEKVIKSVLNDETISENLKHILLDIVQPIAPNCYQRASPKHDFVLNQFVQEYCTTHDCNVEVDISTLTSTPEPTTLMNALEDIKNQLIKQNVNHVDLTIQLCSKLLHIYEESSIASEQVVILFKPFLDNLFKELLKSKKYDQCVSIGNFHHYVNHDDKLYLSFFDQLKKKKEVIPGCEMLLRASPDVYAPFIVKEVIATSPTLKLCVRACKKLHYLVRFNRILLQLFDIQKGTFIPELIESDIIKHFLNGTLTFITYRHAIVALCHIVLYANTQFVINKNNGGSQAFWHYMHLVLELFSKCVHPSSRFQSLLSNQYGLFVDYLTTMNQHEQSILLQRTLVALVQIPPPEME